MNTFKAIRGSSGLYPITQLYVIAVVVLVITVEGWIGLGSAIAILGLTAVIAILIAACAELHLLHHMMDGQRTETLARLDQLEAIISRHGWTLPPEPPKVTEARIEAEEDDA